MMPSSSLRLPVRSSTPLSRLLSSSSSSSSRQQATRSSSPLLLRSNSSSRSPATATSWLQHSSSTSGCRTYTTTSGHAAAAPPPHKAHGDHGSSAGAGHHGEHDDGHEHHEDHYDPPGGWLWGVRPGEKYEKEGWERIFTWFYILPIVVGTIFYVNKEDTTIQTWALEEARRRLDKEGLLTDPFPKGVPNTHAKQTGHD